jgi:CelD/BcsL family acetyltransferase involved in cellulose biosynthesis
VTPARVTVSASRDPRRLDALRPEWAALFDAAPAPSPFLSWEWLSPWWRSFGAGRTPWILEARDGEGRLAGLLLLAGETGALGIRRWRLLGNGVTGADGLDVLARAPDAAAVRDALARFLAASIDAWDVLELEDLPAGSPAIEALRRATAARGATAELERAFVCPGFAVRGTFEAHLARLPRLDTFRRRVRWLSRQPGFRIDVATTPGEAREAIEDFLRLHRLRWAEDGGSAGIPAGPVEDFHRAAAPLLAARGWLRLYRLHVAGGAIASIHGLEVGGRFLYYQSGYDPAWRARSPGLVLVGRTVEDAYARRLDDYDFLRGTEPYKLEWASDRRETCTLRLRAPTLRAGADGLARAALRDARLLARSVAPRRGWEALRRLRRVMEARALAARVGASAGAAG